MVRNAKTTDALLDAIEGLPPEKVAAIQAAVKASYEEGAEDARSHLRGRIDAALRAYVKDTHSQATAYAGPLAPKHVLCAAREEDLVCCLEPEHEGYAGLVDVLVKAVSA